ncbi:MAG: GNAT family N-acetyltransferase [Jatrophihabitantaceae bacterium]
MIVRPAVAEDAAAIIAVRVASWRAAYGAHLPPDVWDGFDPVPAARRLAGSIAARRLLALVAEVDDAVGGYVFYGPARDDDLAAGVGEVYAIYVHPARWSTGAGRALLGAALDELGDVPAVLWVLEVNERARRFYEIAGFRLDGAVKPAELPGGVELPEVRYRIR